MVFHSELLNSQRVVGWSGSAARVPHRSRCSLVVTQSAQIVGQAGRNLVRSLGGIYGLTVPI